MTNQFLLLVAIAIPLIGAVVTALSGHNRNLRDSLMVGGATLGFIAVLSLLPSVLDGSVLAVNLVTMMPGLSIAFAIEPLGMVFALVASGLWILTSVYAIGYMRGAQEKHQTRFFACFSIAIFAALGIAFAENMLTLFIFYEVLSVSTYPLVAHKGNEEAKRGARIYLGLLIGTSIGLMLPAMLVTWHLTGTLDFQSGGILQDNVSRGVGAVLLLLYMFGIGKAALMPFHRWLPSAMVAPTPVSALLHAVAVVKAGVFTVLKVSIYLFGLDYLESLWSSDLIMWVAAFTLLAASIVALQKTNLKARLAYSTVSQLSYITLGAMLASELSIVGGGLHIVMHAFGKITLFFCAGAIYVAAHKTEIHEMDGLARKMPITMGAFLLGALSVIGAPPLGGFWSKWNLMLGAADAQHSIMIAVFLISTLLNIAYLLPPVIRAFLLKPADGAQSKPGIEEAPLFCLVPLTLTAIGTFVLFFVADPIRGFIGTIFGSVM
ncbi:monovalent cation/H+ antiporter subunit D family protein [Orrella marina]|uniref:Cation:proton antiporter n=1 Tax=Orrella marina TaxID=2163011 RepID=A0A2R4XLD7_9BURK|nr:monovalent cation/H+ antiporter subunit D family protein [Orrella marina]AWB34617.1 cation:proton antiporter [Orrella marina]